MRYAQVNLETNVVVNVIELNPLDYEQEIDIDLRVRDCFPSEEASIGMHFDANAGTFHWGPEKAAADIKLKKDTIIAQIAELESGSFLDRGSRELEIENIEERSLKKPDPAQYLATHVYYQKIKTLDTKIAALRVKLGELQ